MKAQFVFEKFLDTTDPIADMGIGIIKEIKDWLESRNLYIDINNTNDLLFTLFYIKDTPDEFINFLLDTRDDYDKSRTLELCFNYQKYQFIDKLLQLGVKFNNLEDKAYYVIELHGKLATLTQDEKMALACKRGDYQKFLELLNDGVKVKIGYINSMIKHEYINYFKVDFYQQDKIINYLKEHIDQLENIIHPKDHNKLNKIRDILSVKKSEKQYSYPVGYKTYRILKFINENKPKSKKDIIKFIVELTYGKGTFNPLTDSNYWSQGFINIIYPRIKKINLADGTIEYTLNNMGIIDLQRLESKFGSMNIESSV